MSPLCRRRERRASCRRSERSRTLAAAAWANRGSRTDAASFFLLRGERNFLVRGQRTHDEAADERGELRDGNLAATGAVEVAVQPDDPDHTAGEEDRVVVADQPGGDPLTDDGGHVG